MADDEWLDGLPERVRVLCCIAADDADWEAAVGRIARSGRVALAEVTTRDAASRAARAGAVGVVLAGHEAGGRCGDDSSFVLLQAVLADATLPAWVRGGIGPTSAAGCVAMGAAGVVLDGALLLAKESPLDEPARQAVARLDGTETSVLRREGGSAVRVYSPPRSAAVDRRQGVGRASGQAWPIGQDAAFAASLAKRYVTTGGIIQAVEAAIDRGIALAREHRPLAPKSSLAKSHGTEYPIVQGPMTRVSDTAGFASAVADGGALPFLALAMLRGPEVRALLDDARTRLQGRAWGVGVLGFVTPELRREQVEAVREARPPFALIAGGRPDQAKELEDEGIRTYLHVPSPGLLGQYLKAGARRFILEGRECGGHVGPRTSLVLWEQAVGVLREFIEAGNSAEELHVLFAGGIHDARSSAGVAAIAAPLAAKGVKVGVLIGTAYLFTEEAVSTGAIVPQFQAEAIRCRRTILLETGPGHEVRVGPSPFANAFAEQRRRLIAEGKPAEAIRAELERMNAGRLRVAAKGLDRAVADGSRLISVDEAGQYQRGVYMLGQIAAIRDRVTTIADLHREISDGGDGMLQADETLAAVSVSPSKPSDVAIVGLSAIFPGAGDLRAFWENTLKGHDAIIEIPPDRWDHRPYYDPDLKTPDKIVSKWGGFVPDVPFDPLGYGMPPMSLSSIEPVQLLVLEAARKALEDAGYADRPFPRERTAVVLGMGGGAAQLAMGYAFRSYLPMLESVAPEAGKAAREAAAPFLPEWTEDSFPGFLLNVAAGRVANRFDLGGSNFTVDAACGSSLAAASLAVRELETGAADMVILGGADTVQNPLTYLAFSKTHAFSPRGRCRPFDASADGIVISEGVGVVILKRLADAERDGDRIYAVIKGMGTSSDGRHRGLTAPNIDGQTRALERAYEKSGVDPATLGYVEAHGTGTAVGDVVEVNALGRLLRDAGAGAGSCAVGSVKSMIGHTKCAAGIAGLINASLALHHKVLPPTIGVDTVNPKADLADGPLRVSAKPRPWFHAEQDRPRRAGVSAFGFGGTNFHAVLEGYDRDPAPTPAPTCQWPAELLLWRSETPAEIAVKLENLAQSLDKGATPRLRDLARSLADRYDSTATSRPTLAIVARSLDDLRPKLATALQTIRSGQARLSDKYGIEYAERPEFAGEKVVFLFPGQGSQSLEMLGDLAFAFPEVRESFEAFDAALKSVGREPIASRVFPSTTLDDAGREQARHALMATDVAQPAIGAASVGMLRLLRTLGVEADAVAGHSFGELVALHAAGCMPVDSLAVLAAVRGRLMREAAGSSPGTMAAVAAGPERVAAWIEPGDGVVIANLNGPRQTVISGPRDAVVRVVERARVQGAHAVDLPVACAFHSRSVAAASRPLAEQARSLLSANPDRPVYANIDAARHPADRAAIAGRLGEQLASPVRFTEMVEAMQREGGRIFVEVGPGAVLTPMVGAILGDRKHLAVATDAPGRPGIPAFLQALARLAVAGVVLRPGRLTAGRDAARIDPECPPVGDGRPPLSASSWLVNGSRARPIGGPEPKRLGQAAPVPPQGVEPLPPSRNGRHPAATSNGQHGPGLSKTMKNHRLQDPAPSLNGHHPRLEAAETARNGNGRIPTDASPRPSPTRNGHNVPGTTPANGTAGVMQAFQETMRAFLETQRATMLAYLGHPEPPPTTHQPTLRRWVEGGEIPAATSTEVDAMSTSVVNGHANGFHKAERGTQTVEAHAGTGSAVEEIHSESVPSPEVGSLPAETSLPAFGREAVAGRLVEIVRDRTGYPAEMLKLDLDLEADLGIDSIKRVEILGTLRETIDGLDSAADSSLMDDLARARTLGAIADRVAATLEKCRAVLPSQPERVPDLPPTAEPATAVRRMTLEAVDAPLSGSRRGLMVGGVVVVTDDGRGVAVALGKVLQTAGHRIAIVGRDRVDFSSPGAVEATLDEVRASGPIAGIVHALPLRNVEAPGLAPAAWSDRMGAEVKGLFLLARAASPDLERAATKGGACLVAATAMGGSFATTDAMPDAFFPGQGGIAGLVKTLAREWPEVRTRVVDLDPSEPSERLAVRLADEALADDG